MRDKYKTLKFLKGFVELKYNDKTYNVYLFEETIPEINLKSISDYELEILHFEIPVIFDFEKFKESKMMEGYMTKTFKLTSISEFSKL